METKSKSTVPEPEFAAPNEEKPAPGRSLPPTEVAKGPESKKSSIGLTSGLGVGVRTWTEVSRINYLSSHPSSIVNLGEIMRRSLGIPFHENSKQCFMPTYHLNKNKNELFSEQFPVNRTPLMNEDRLWGCFYTFPELYSDVYSPIVRIRNIEDVPELVGGVLTRDMVTACLSYLKRSPILGDYVYIKLEIPAKYLTNIDVLQHYKYLVYLDLSTNLLTELTVLSSLPYLQFLSVAFNRLNTVLDYDTPQWFLTEVHYKFNSVKKIRDLSVFWSITILDLSHNNITVINGLESLMYLRRLDLSFNHIQCLENINHLRLLWLDVSYNNLSSFEISPTSGLWTLLHLEYLNLNENNLMSMKIFRGCTRLRELHCRNNRFSMLLELAVYMRQMRRLINLDLRGNPICSTPGYKGVAINTFPTLLSLDAQELDPVDQRSYKLDMTPDINTFATRRLLRQLYIEQLTKAHVSPNIPPADATDVPLVVLVGYEGVKKGTLARRLAKECSSHIELAKLHTTAPYHHSNRYKEVSRDKFDDMLLAGELLTYSETDGESYGLSREEAFINEGKVKVVCMDLIGAFMLKLRGLRPYLILVTRLDKHKLSLKQKERKNYRNIANEKRFSLEPTSERSTLQVLLSGRIVITGILNEILMKLPEDKENSEFVIDSECSLMVDSDQRQTARNYVRGFNLVTSLTSSTTTLDEEKKHHEKFCQMDPSLYSLYKGSQTAEEYKSFANANGQNSYQDRSHGPNHDIRQSRTKNEKNTNNSRPKSVDFGKHTSSSKSWKGFSVVPECSKSSKSVTFISHENADDQNISETGMLIEPRNPDIDEIKSKVARSISTKVPCESGSQPSAVASGDDLDLWLSFLFETGLLQTSSLTDHSSDTSARQDTRMDDPDSIITHLANYLRVPCETNTTNIRDDYEDIHIKSPGVFWDTVATDNFNEAFVKARGIIFNIYNSQPKLKPMFDIDFANLTHHPTIETKLNKICKEIAPQRLFH